MLVELSKEDIIYTHVSNKRSFCNSLFVMQHVRLTYKVILVV